VSASPSTLHSVEQGGNVSVEPMDAVTDDLASQRCVAGNYACSAATVDRVHDSTAGVASHDRTLRENATHPPAYVVAAGVLDVVHGVTRRPPPLLGPHVTRELVAAAACSVDRPSAPTVCVGLSRRT